MLGTHGPPGWDRPRILPTQIAKGHPFLFHQSLLLAQISRILAMGLIGLDGGIRTIAKLWVTGRVDRAKWCLWNGKPVKGLHYLQGVQDWLIPSRQRGAPEL